MLSKGKRPFAACIAVLALSAQAQTAAPVQVLPGSAPADLASGAASAPRKTASNRGVVIDTNAGSTSFPAAGKLKAQPAIETGPRRTLTVGEVTTIGLPNIARVAIGNGGVIKATVVDDGQLVLLAEAPGETGLHVWLKNGRQITYTVQVHPVHYEQLQADITAMVKDMPGVSVRTVGDRVVLEGRYPDSEAVAKIKILGENFPQLLNLISGKPADADPLQLERMVQLDLRVIEVKKRALDQLGIKWANTGNGPTFATNLLGYANTPWRPDTLQGFPLVNTAHPAATFFGLATQITSALSFLEENGDAWTLAEPRLSCRSGGESKFVAGGEIPIPVAQGNGAISVIYKQYGVLIEFRPVADGGGNVQSGIVVEVSEPDPRNSNQGFIAFTTNRAETQVAIKEGEPLVIAGLFRDKVDKSHSGIPGIGRIPLFSYLFGAHETRTEQTELVVLVTPRVVTPQSALNKLAVDRGQTLSESIRAKTDGRLNRAVAPEADGPDLPVTPAPTPSTSPQP
ncbi:MAG TPA: pilus assembly protein N-terminal domain-containing protein [Ideonella sp.]|uniref:type II and III secretion system protein family protein n=1 Tax=Ideonella sp. TaxID=1929293 RepID=UPI002C116425|nr:pilus assembly protein N-terminal domain-containing protein [Ideonella sp.]HSI48229.1 pilus assembly protein N-terminal domain-containing protein [Ideonella sp.]